VEEKFQSSLSTVIPVTSSECNGRLGDYCGKFLKSDHGFQKMLVCEFLRCTLSELRERIKNPADYFIILAYKDEKGERIRHEMEKVRR